MKVQIINQISKAILVSNITVDQFEAVKAYKPEVLAIKNEDGDEIFRINYSLGGRPSVESFGINFTNKNSTNCISVEIPVPADVEDKLNWVRENHFAVLLKLRSVEAGIINTLNEAMELKESLDDIFTILD